MTSGGQIRHFESLTTPYAFLGVEWEEEVEFLGNVSSAVKTDPLKR
jgi:hypothetical protein